MNCISNEDVETILNDLTDDNLNTLKKMCDGNLLPWLKKMQGTITSFSSFDINCKIEMHCHAATNSSDKKTILNYHAKLMFFFSENQLGSLGSAVS